MQSLCLFAVLTATSWVLEHLENIGAFFLPKFYRQHSKLKLNTKSQFENNKQHENEFKKMPTRGSNIKIDAV